MDKGRDYENEIVRILENRMRTDLRSEQFSCYRRKRYPGKSGSSHEIDISFEFLVGGIAILIAVECKNYGRRVGQDVAAHFKSVLEDINANKGVIISQHGFQKGAITFSEHHSIALATFCNFVYTPLVGDPEFQEFYATRLFNYIKTKPDAGVNLSLHYGNAYRSEAILSVDDTNSILLAINEGKRVESGFALISETSEIPVDPTDLILVLAEMVKRT